MDSLYTFPNNKREMKNKRKEILLCIGMFMISVNSVSAQNKITGYIMSSTHTPIADAVISYQHGKSVKSASDGSFTVDSIKVGDDMNIWHEGFYSKTIYIDKNTEKKIKIYMIETDKTRYNETALLPYQPITSDPSVAGTVNINKKDFSRGSISVDNVIKGEITGLDVINKSGMTGEGAYLQLRGIKSLLAENSPLIVINGVPYMPDQNLSQIINGYSRSIFQAFNIQDIRNITVLKGAQAAIYGSMGSNGVIMIETDQASATNMNTRISFSAIYGSNWNNRRIPLMNSNQYKSYLSDIGLTYYKNMESFFNDFSFLSDPNANHAYLYQYNTNWQDAIYHHNSMKDYLFRVEGGDNIAKYNISLGYMNDGGILRSTESSRYNAQINASILVNKKFEIRTAINTAYMKGQYQEQGLSLETNPLLAAYRRSPLLSPYKSDIYGNLIDTYSSYWYGAIENQNFIVSNPVAIVNTLSGKNRQYDINAKIQFMYKPKPNLFLNGIVGMYYNYNQEQTFIPGINNNDISPLFDQYGEANNTIRVGTNHTFNMFYGLNASYQLNLDEKSKFHFMGGWQAIIDSYEYDAAFGRNSNNDFYQTLGDAQALGKYFSGYNNKWNWMNFFVNADYIYDNLIKLGAVASFDGASSIGKNAARMTLYPAVDAVLMAKQFKRLKDLEWINKLNIYTNYGITGNSRYSSKYGKYYYTSRPYQTIAGIVRANVPNTKLKAEKDYTLNLGFETSMLCNRLQINLGYYNVQAKDVLVNYSRSSLSGTSACYGNGGELSSKGLELSISFSPIYNKKFRWTIGGNLTTLNNKVRKLADESEYVTTLSDGAEIITRVGESPYSFYGYKTKGVFSTTAEANSANLANSNGVKYTAGDIHYVDQNNDGIINDKDKVVLGSATPDIFGNVFSRFEYRNYALDMTFVYSCGNDAYNAVRRITESGLDFSNQSTALNRRWSMEGQITDIPKVSYGDKIGNNDFSDRWVENASYLKLRDITLTYTWKKPLLNFIQGGSIFLTGRNLLCLTDYLGLDPEFSYSYSSVLQGVDDGKVNAPKSIEFGIKLKF
jgi:TonB-linked SusC/RagA family outer membrane protein